MAQGTFQLFNMFQNYVRNGVVGIDSGTWRIILCSNSVSALSASEVNPARGSTNITEVSQGGGYTTGGIELTLANTSASSVFTFAADTGTHTNGTLSWSQAAGSPTNIRTAVLIDDNADSPVDAALGFWDMTDDGSTPISLASVDIDLILDNTSGKIFEWTTS